MRRMILILMFGAFCGLIGTAEENVQDYPVRFVVGGSIYSPSGGCSIRLDSDGKWWFVHDEGRVHCHTFPRGTVLQGKFVHMTLAPSIYILASQPDGKYKVYKYLIVDQFE